VGRVPQDSKDPGQSAVRLTTERDVSPGLGVPIQPAVRLELQGIELRVLVVLRLELETEGGIEHCGTLQNANWSKPVGSTTSRQSSVNHRAALVDWDSRIESQSLGESVREIFHVLELLVGGSFSWSNNVEDFLAESFEDIRTLAKFVEHPAQGAGGSVTTCQESGHELVSKEGAVGVVGCKRMKQSVLVITRR